MSEAPQVGSPAPDFSLPAAGGGTLSLEDFRGQTLILYFYPKDDTSGCTKQAIGFSERLSAFQESGAAVVGVSKDSVARHDKFAEKHGLKVALLSDAESDLAERYDVWKEKAMYGRKYMGIERSTFLIDGEGVLRREWRKVRVPGHVEEVLEAVRAL